MAGENKAAQSVWEKVTTIAEEFNNPGGFTLMIGYEWKSVPGGRNLHRNIIYRDGKSHADQALPSSSYDYRDTDYLRSRERV